MGATRYHAWASRKSGFLRKIKNAPEGIFCKLGGQLGPALVAAAAQHGAAGFACHPLHETVFMRAVALLWLVRSFWHMRLLYKKAAQRANGVVLTIQIRRCTQTYPPSITRYPHILICCKKLCITSPLARPKSIKLVVTFALTCGKVGLAWLY